MRCERGQASVEWTALLLVVALVLAALLVLVPRVEGRRLGGLIAERIGCAARGGCTERVRRAPRPREVPWPRRVSAETPAASTPAAALPLPLRRAARAITKRAWIACIGYRRYHYEREHPARLDAFQRLPLRDALSIANACLNPYGFLGEGRDHAVRPSG